ncbi:hypothetical protein [uncultured Shewanella sp.]|uniref:hypothetical protein n=1 Tax=uncultured Shewanella sp. TaxID=173975 RepID=UPI00261BD0CB|nr:hypothetical protein [uncultured Shewanella sp.]
MKLAQTLISAIIPFAFFSMSFASHAGGVKQEAYCIDNGGTVEKMIAKYGSDMNGFSKAFCTFSKDNGFVAVGLSTFASNTPNIAATLMTQLSPIAEDSPLWEGDFFNPSMNVCKNLGGATMSENVVSGGFTNAGGANDICVFGDTSMVSAWSLIYIANGRDHYDEVKNAVRSLPIDNLYIPE